MKEIKTKLVIKDIKALDKTADVSRRMKNSYIRTKNRIEPPEHNNDCNYVDDAGNNIQEGTEAIVKRAGHVTENYGKKVIRRGKQLLRQSASRHGSKKKFANGTIKTSQKSVKTAERTAKATIKTSQAATKTAAKAAVKSAEASKIAIQSARMAVRATAASIRMAARAIAVIIKASIAAVKSVVALIAAGGWIAVVVILVVCLTGFFIGSVYGVFFSNQSSSRNTPILSEVISQLNEEFSAEMQRIQNDNPHDTLELTGNASGIVNNWPEILAVYAVRVSTDPENGMEVATLDNAKVGILREIFRDMNPINYRLETIERKETITTKDKNGKEVEKTITVSEIILHINVTSKSYVEMIQEYGFSGQQVKMLNELMKEENQQLFLQLIGS